MKLVIINLLKDEPITANRPEVQVTHTLNPNTLYSSDVDELKKLVEDKEKEILRVRGDYFRLVEQFKSQIQERQVLVESLTNEDAKNMKLMLQLQTQITEAERQADKQLYDMQTAKEAEL